MNNLRKKIFLSLAAVLLISTFSYSQHDMEKGTTEKTSTEPVGIKTDDGILYGKEIEPGMTVIEFNELMKNPVASDGQTLLVKGTIAEVCQAMGCWMTLSDGPNNARVKTLHKFFLPKDIAGQNAIVFGKFNISEISEEDARHYNEESNNPKVKTEDIKGPQKVFEMEAQGIKVLNAATELKDK